MSLSQLHKIIRGVLIIAPIMLALFLVHQDLVVSGQLAAEYDFKHNSPFILTLGPKERISEIQKENGDYYQSLYDDPIYFDLRLPRNFKIVTFWITYRANPAGQIKLAGFVNKDQWQFIQQEFTEVKDLGNGWQEGKVVFNVSKLPFVNQKYQMMISLTGEKGSVRQVDITNIQILAEREPLTLGNLFSRIEKKINRYE
ncbi:MAG: hypothetical protein WC480_02950 [Patescibacteria group bacterium]